MKNLKILFPAILMFLVVSVQSCKEDDDDLTPPTVLAIGDFHQGGIIFYLDSTKTHGYVCTSFNQSNGCEWGCEPSVVTGAYSVGIGLGAQNTNDIISVCSSQAIAAGICDSLMLNGYEDWFLPSKDELNEVYKNQDVINITAVANGGERLETTNYWTSSHAQSNTAWVQSFGSGGTQIAEGQNNMLNHMRAVRAF
jgi:hypothetical protein